MKMREKRGDYQKIQEQYSVGDIYIGLMSGTSLDGIDAIAAQFPSHSTHSPPIVLAEAYSPFEPALRQTLLELQQPSENEIDKEARAAHALTLCYATVIHTLLDTLSDTLLNRIQRGDAISVSGLSFDQLTNTNTLRSTIHRAIRAIGVHGQTIRHCPRQNYTRQINDPALLAELTGIDVIADFRSRDLAAGGQGAPLVPAFHARLLGTPKKTQAVCNIGGISNVTILNPNGDIRGWDCGPGNVLMDYWASRHTDKNYDDQGQLAARGQVYMPLLTQCLKDDYFQLPPPKSTGRDIFHPAWLKKHLTPFPDLSPADIQATLTELTAHCIAHDLLRYAPDCESVYICGGGERNPILVQALMNALQDFGLRTRVYSTKDIGIPAHQMEALTFAWLAMQFTERKPGNLPRVTGACGPRILGALYPY